MTGDDEPINAHENNLEETAAHGVDLGTWQAPVRPYRTFEDWEIDQNVRQLQARIAPWQRHDEPALREPSTASPALRSRADGGHQAVPGPHQRTARRAPRSGVAARAIVWLGLAAFTFGAALLAWSFVEDRLELWSLGVPILAAGQVTLLVGLALQLERVWQNSRSAVRKLSAVGTQLHRLERSAALAGATHGSAAGVFYAHLADSAPPHVLVADLKGQLDLLAGNLARRRA